MQKAIGTKSRWAWLNLMVKRDLVLKEKAIKLKRNMASGAVVYNPIVGLISKIELDRLVETRAIIKRRVEDITRWSIATSEIIKNGKKILTVSEKYSSWVNKKRAIEGVAHYDKEALDSLIEQEEIDKTVDALFPGNTKVV